MKLLRKVVKLFHIMLDRAFVALDRKQNKGTRGISQIPNLRDRRGGKRSYAEWAHVIGTFQTLMYVHLPKKSSNTILDIGCGTGLLCMASEPFIGQGGKYIGLDVQKKDIAYCRRHYGLPNVEFDFFDVFNPAYTTTRPTEKAQWSIDDGTIDMVTALSVWTHFGEADALFYFQEISRVLAIGGIAIVTFFVLDDLYYQTLETRTAQSSAFSMESQSKWIFEKSAYGSDAWFHPKWVEVPERAIGVTQSGLERLISSSGLSLTKHYQGNWKEVPGAYLQDVLIFERES